MAGDSGEKKHEATPHRREQNRKEGRFARARDAGGLGATLGALAALAGTSEQSLAGLRLCFARTHGDLGAITRGDGPSVWSMAAGVLLSVAGPAALAAATGAVLAGVAQAGFRLDFDLVAWKTEHLDPFPRLARLFSPRQALVETSLAAARVGVVAILAQRALRAELPALLGLSAVPLPVAFRSGAAMALRLVLQVVAGLVVLAVVDYAQSRFSLARESRMSTQEMKEEQRQQDGDPRMKARRLARARAALRRRMMNDVKKADVIVTNPTHIAVALRYQQSDAAPVVLAKGHDEAALRIRAEARKYGIPIVENRPLARALDAEIQVGQSISGAHYAAVAHVLAFVYRLRARRGGGGPRRA
jgi:flagellar biosynthetic protein FlhB